MKTEKTSDEWAEAYGETVIFKELSDKQDRIWRLQTGDPDVVRRVRRKKGYKQVAWPEWGFIWIFRTTFKNRRNAIRALARILDTETFWEKKRALVAARDDSKNDGVAS